MNKQNKETKTFESILNKLEKHQSNASVIIGVMAEAITSARLRERGQAQADALPIVTNPALLTRGYLTFLYEQTAKLSNLARLENARKDDDMRLAIHRFMARHNIEVDDLDLNAGDLQNLDPVAEKFGTGRFETLLPPRTGSVYALGSPRR